MMLRRLALCLGLGLMLVSCGKHSSDNRAPSGARQANSAAAAKNTASRSAATPQKPGEQSSDLPSKITRMNEDGSETVEDVPSDSGAHNPLLAAVASTVTAATSSAAAATLNGPTLWQEGVNYTRLVPAQPTEVPAGQVEVLEFFWYACPHCNAIDPMVENWLKTKPAYITFSRVHVLWSEGHRSLARLYYTLQSMGKLEQLHTEIFKEIHVHNDPLVASDPSNTSETERMQTTFVKRFGISADDFSKAYHSFAVDTALQHADQLVQRYRIEGVPSFVINGKFVADVRTADGPERLLNLVGDLAAQEHKR